MRLLALSDIQSGPASVLSLAERVAPDAILMAGDLVDVGFTHKSKWLQLQRAFDQLEESGIPTFIVRGNKDISPFFEASLRPRYQHVQLLGFSPRYHNAITLLGVPHGFTADLESVRSLEHHPPAPVDIVLAHAESCRRPWLFFIPARVIVTGHFDLKLAYIRETVFVSMWEFPHQHATIDIDPYRLQVRYFQENIERASLLKSPEALQWGNRLKGSEEYERQVEGLFSARSQLQAGKISRGQAIVALHRLNVPSHHTREFLAKAAMRSDELPNDS